MHIFIFIFVCLFVCFSKGSCCGRSQIPLYGRTFSTVSLGKRSSGNSSTYGQSRHGLQYWHAQTNVSKYLLERGRLHVFGFVFFVTSHDLCCYAHAYGGGHISGVTVNNVVIQIKILFGVSLCPPCLWPFSLNNWPIAWHCNILLGLRSCPVFSILRPRGATASGSQWACTILASAGMEVCSRG